MKNAMKWSAELRCAEDLARAAGRATLPYWGSVRASLKVGGSPVTEADLLANRVILDGLRTQYPGDAVLSEESRDSVARLSHERVWIVDPLDGTREFIAGIGEYAVMIGLSVGGEAVLGAVYCPADDTMYAGIVDEGAWIERGGRRHRLTVPGEISLNGSAASRSTDRLRLVGSRSHPDERLVRIQTALGITDVRPSGSVGVKCALIATGECDLYVHPVPYLKEWDTCAPEAVLRAAGGSVTDCRGGSLRYNKPAPVQPDGIVATLPGVFPGVIDVVRAVWAAGPAAEPLASS